MLLFHCIWRSKLFICHFVKVQGCRFSRIGLCTWLMIHMGLGARKPVFRVLRSNKTQTSLLLARILKLRKGPLCLILYGKRIHVRRFSGSVDAHASLRLCYSLATNSGFLTTRAICDYALNK